MIHNKFKDILFGRETMRLLRLIKALCEIEFRQNVQASALERDGKFCVVAKLLLFPAYFLHQKFRNEGWTPGRSTLFDALYPPQTEKFYINGLFIASEVYSNKCYTKVHH